MEQNKNDQTEKNNKTKAAIAGVVGAAALAAVLMPSTGGAETLRVQESPVNAPVEESAPTAVNEISQPQKVETITPTTINTPAAEQVVVAPLQPEESEAVTADNQSVTVGPQSYEDIAIDDSGMYPTPAASPQQSDTATATISMH